MLILGMGALARDDGAAVLASARKLPKHVVMSQRRMLERL